MLSDHNKKITLDKYTFALEYDDEFDMSEIEVQQVDEVFTLFSGEFSLDGEEMDAPMPGLLVKLTLTRIVSYFIVQVAETLAYCLFCFSTPPSYICALTCSSTSHLPFSSSLPTSPSSCLPRVLWPGVASRLGFISHSDLVLMFALQR